MILNEKKQNILLVPNEYSLVYTVSRDFLAIKGLPAKLKNKYPTMISTVKRAYKKAKDPDIKCIGFKPLKDKRYIYNLIVKNKVTDQVTYEELFDALIQLKDDMAVMDVKKIAMPKLCIGNDGLNWAKVKETIELVFDTTDIEILVCCSVLDKDNPYVEEEKPVKIKKEEKQEENEN